MLDRFTVNVQNVRHMALYLTLSSQSVNSHLSDLDTSPVSNIKRIKHIFTKETII